MKYNEYYGNKIIYILLISYFIFLITSGIGVSQYKNPNPLDTLQNKYIEIEDKYNYMINNIDVGNIEDNNKEIIYLEELKEQILDSVNREGDFWLADLKNIILNKEENLLNSLGKEQEISPEYLKLKNELDEYNFYYSLGKRPINYLDSMFMRYFTFIFNSKAHQIFLTFIVLSICYAIIRSMEYMGFLRTLLLTCIPILLIQVLSFLICIAIDGTMDILYPIRVVENFTLQGPLDFGNSINDKTLPLYRVILNVFFLEFLYMIFLISFIKIIDLVFTKYYLKICGMVIFLLSMMGMVKTKYSSISVFSYGKFLDITRGYEALYRGDTYLNVKFFSIFISCIVMILTTIYLLKKYVLHNHYI